MAIELIGTIKPKNNGSFPMVDAADVDCGNNLRLDDALNAVHSVPAGGTQGQVLKKSSGVAYDVAWGDAPTELPAVSSTDNGKVLGVSSGVWAAVNAPSGLPSGGSAGEVLVKQSSVAGDAVWASPITLSFDDTTGTLSITTLGGSAT